MMSSASWGSIMQMAAGMGMGDVVSYADSYMVDSYNQELEEHKKLEDLLSGRGAVPAPSPKEPLKSYIEEYLQAVKLVQEKCNSDYDDVLNIMERCMKKEVLMEVAIYKVLEMINGTMPERIEMCKQKLTIAYYIEGAGEVPSAYGFTTSKEVENELQRLKKKHSEVQTAQKNVRALVMKEFVEPLRKIREEES